MDRLCANLCPGGEVITPYERSFCDSMFPVTRIGGGIGEIRCTCGVSTVRIDSMTFEKGQKPEAEPQETYPNLFV
jgi:hypothetical protein